MMNFQPINSNEYLVEDNVDLIEQVDGIFKILNQDKVYEDNVQTTLYDSVYSRLLTTTFFNIMGDEITNQLGFVIIRSTVRGRVIKCSVGTIDTGIDGIKKINGVLYD